MKLENSKGYLARGLLYVPKKETGLEAQEENWKKAIRDYQKAAKILKNEVASEVEKTPENCFSGVSFWKKDWGNAATGEGSIFSRS